MTKTATSSLDVLQHHYTHRLAAAHEAHASGQRVIGVIGNTVPREMITAAGAVPVLVAPELGAPTPRAEQYMEEVIAPTTKALFELALSGELELLDLLVLARPYAHLFYYLKEIYRQGRAPSVPPLHMFDLMQSQREAVATYNSLELDRLRQRLRQVTGAAIDDEALRGAARATNVVRAAQRQVQARRWATQLSGCEALQVLGAGYFMPPEAYARAVNELLAESRTDPGLTDRPRLLVITAEPLGHLHLHRALESAGAVVVAEDDWWGAQAPGADIDVAAPPMAALLDKYWHGTPSSAVLPADAREAWLREHAPRDEVDGVVIYLPPSDHQLGWDYPRLASWLADVGKPVLRLRTDAASAGGAERISAEAGAWLAELPRTVAAS